MKLQFHPIHSCWHLGALCLSLLTAAPLAAQVKTFYVIKSLGTLGGNFSDARNLNDKGEIVGVSKTAGGQDHAFVYLNGVMQDLGTLGGDNSIASAISGDGDIVGTAQKVGGEYRAVRFSRFAAAFNTDISPPLSVRAEATANNDRGGGDEAVNVDFEIFAPPAKLRAFRLPGITPLNPQLLTTLGGNDNRAFGMNESGDIVGSSLTAGDALRKAFVFTGGNTTSLGDLGGTNSEARDINNSNRIVGWSDIAGGGRRAFLYFNGAILNLGTLGGNSFAHAINDNNEIVGTSETAGPGSGAAFLYKNTTMTNLNTVLPANSGWNLIFANGINESGQIVGHGTFNGAGRAFLLEPDRKAPVVKPKSRFFATNLSSLTVSGTALDEGTVRIVQFRVGGKGPFRKAAGTTRWSFRVPLKEGRNLVEIRARDTGGLVSRVAKVNITRS